MAKYLFCVNTQVVHEEYNGSSARAASEAAAVPVAGRFRTKHRSFGSLRPSSERIRSVIAPPMTAIIAVLGGMAIRISVNGKLVIT